MYGTIAMAAGLALVIQWPLDKTPPAENLMKGNGQVVAHQIHRDGGIAISNGPVRDSGRSTIIVDGNSVIRLDDGYHGQGLRNWDEPRTYLPQGYSQFVSPLIPMGNYGSGGVIRDQANWSVIVPATDKATPPTPVIPTDAPNGPTAQPATQPQPAKPARPDLGIKIAELPLLLRLHITPLLGPETGILVVEVPVGTVGAAAGLKAGDLLIGFNGWPVTAGTKWDELYSHEMLFGARLGIVRAGRLEVLRVPVAEPQPLVAPNNLAISAATVNGRVSISVSGVDAAGQKIEWKFDGTREELEAALKKLPADLAQQLRDAADGRPNLIRPIGPMERK